MWKSNQGRLLESNAQPFSQLTTLYLLYIKLQQSITVQVETKCQSTAVPTEMFYCLFCFSVRTCKISCFTTAFEDA